jgi:hypothetical protein
MSYDLNENITEEQISNNYNPSEESSEQESDENHE